MLKGCEAWLLLHSNIQPWTPFYDWAQEYVGEVVQNGVST